MSRTEPIVVLEDHDDKVGAYLVEGERQRARQPLTGIPGVICLHFKAGAVNE